MNKKALNYHIGKMMAFCKYDESYLKDNVNEFIVAFGTDMDLNEIRNGIADELFNQLGNFIDDEEKEEYIQDVLDFFEVR